MFEIPGLVVYEGALFVLNGTKPTDSKGETSHPTSAQITYSMEKCPS
jgi:hypothetical protein